MSSKVSKTIEDCETYLNATPPATFAFLKAVGDLLDVEAAKSACKNDSQFPI